MLAELLCTILVVPQCLDLNPSAGMVLSHDEYLIPLNSRLLCSIMSQAILETRTSTSEQYIQ